jgi:hypothetical protein
MSSKTMFDVSEAMEGAPKASSTLMIYYVSRISKLNFADESTHSPQLHMWNGN